MSRLCAAGCGTPVVGRADKRYCSEVCSKRARRRAAVAQQLPAGPPSTRVADALTAELEGLGVADSYEGATALNLARQLDSGSIVGAAYVSLSKELDRRVAVLRLKAERPDDPVAALQRRLDAKLLRLVPGGGS